MGVSKTNLFTAEQNEIATMSKAFSHPARVAIIQHLLACNACINSDLVNELGLAQSTISQHLKELKLLGIVQGTVEGVSMNYCLNPDKWKQVGSIIGAFFDQAIAVKEENCC